MFLMSFHIYQLVEPLILLNTSINLSSYKLLINLSAIFTNQGLGPNTSKKKINFCLYFRWNSKV
jgi:hypothetical protein